MTTDKATRKKRHAIEMVARRIRQDQRQPRWKHWPSGCNYSRGHAKPDGKFRTPGDHDRAEAASFKRLRRRCIVQAIMRRQSGVPIHQEAGA